jgi:hypothetical protein
MTSTYGLEVWDAEGRSSVSLHTRLTRVLFRHYASANASGSAFVDRNGATAAFPMAVLRYSSGLSYDQARVPHSVSFSGNTVSWSPHSDSSIRGPSEILVLSYG